MPIISWVSTGRLFGLEVYELNASPSQGCSPYALLNDWAPLSPLTPRRIGAPPVPDSTGMVSAIRWSNAPATKAPLPYREQPVTPSESPFSTPAPDCWTTSMIRLTPHDQAISSPVELVLP